MAGHSYLTYLKFAVLLLIIAGCEEYKYSIEMEPGDQGIERKLTISDNVPDEKKAAIAKLYQNQIAPNIFRGTFDTNLPNDVGGAGFYTTFDTDMGKAVLYSERFRGNDNLNDTLDKAKLFVDRVVDFFIGWLEYELGDEPNFAALKTFCNKNLRSDVKNMAVYLWLSNVLEEYKGNDSDEIPMRMIHYFIERDYLESRQIYFTSFGIGDDEQTLRIIRQWIAKKMGYSSDANAAEKLDFLSDPGHAKESAQAYIRTTELFKKAWEEKKLEQNDPNAERPQIDVDEYFEYMMQDIDLGPDFFSFNTNKVEVKLACRNEPFATNGRWDEQASQVLWSSNIADNIHLPTFFYASWGEPNVEFQQKHFGRVVLAGENMAQYCVWRESLNEENAKEWDSFILSLSPGEDLEGRLNSFRFSSERQKEQDEDKSDLAREPRGMILAGLKSEKEKEDTKSLIDRQ